LPKPLLDQIQPALSLCSRSRAMTRCPPFMWPVSPGKIQEVWAPEIVQKGR
jgi:hypothetical protein